MGTEASTLLADVLMQRDRSQTPNSLGLKTIFKWRCSDLESAHGDGHEEGPGAAGAAVVPE